MKPILVADIGGTYARTALVHPAVDPARPPQLLAYEKCRCADYPALGVLLKSFLERHPGIPVGEGVVACSGSPSGDAIINDTLPWAVSISGMRSTLGFADVAVVNDFEAIGYGIGSLEVAGSERLGGPDTHPIGPVLIVGPGTGLGACVALRRDGKVQVIPSEAGQAQAAATTARERQVLVEIAGAATYVPYERILSGPGLLTLYRAVAALNGRAPRLASPSDVSAAATASSDPDAVEALDLFCAMLGGFVGDAAMTFMATGGVYLIGGVVTAIHHYLPQSRFMERFQNKGSMRAYLEHLPVRVAEQRHHAIIGAAQWYFQTARPSSGSAGAARVQP